MCRSLGYSSNPEPVIAALSEELDQAYRTVINRLPDNPAVRFERINGKDELVLSPLDELEEPDSLKALRAQVAARIPRAELPEILLEIATRTGFIDAFTHINDGKARVADLVISLCAYLLSEAMNTGIEPLVRNDHPALRRERLIWLGQNYFRNETNLSKVAHCKNEMKEYAKKNGLDPDDYFYKNRDKCRSLYKQ